MENNIAPQEISVPHKIEGSAVEKNNLIKVIPFFFLALLLLGFVSIQYPLPKNDSNIKYLRGYKIKDNIVLYESNEAQGWPVDIPIAEADAKTFHLFDIVSPYAIDKKNIFYNKKIIPDADIETFQVLDVYGYAVDKNHVFHNDKVISDTPSGFNVVSRGSSVFLTDNGKVYLNGKEIVGAIASNFKVLEGFYSTDGTSLFCGLDMLPKADPKTFSLLNGYYSKDSHNVYFCSTAENIKPFIVEGADITTFSVSLDGISSLDKNHSYYKGLIKN